MNILMGKAHAWFTFLDPRYLERLRSNTKDVVSTSIPSRLHDHISGGQWRHQTQRLSTWWHDTSAMVSVGNPHVR